MSLITSGGTSWDNTFWWFLCFSCDWRCGCRLAMCHPGGDVHRIPHEEERRGLIRPGRAQALSNGQLLHQELKPRVLRLRHRQPSLNEIYLTYSYYFFTPTAQCSVGSKQQHQQTTVYSVLNTIIIIFKIFIKKYYDSKTHNTTCKTRDFFNCVNFVLDNFFNGVHKKKDVFKKIYI